MRRQPRRQFQDVDVKSVNRTEQINSVEDLPPVENGFHQLEDMTEYHFNGFVTSENGIELGMNTPLKGFHGGSGGFIYTGGETALKADNQSVFLEDFLLSAPGGQAFDFVGGDNDMLIDSITVADPMGMGDIEDLGVIEGFRVPVIELSNFEDFNVGLEYRGQSDKIFLFGSPFRNTSAEYAVRLHESVDSEFADISRCFFFNFDDPDAPGVVVDDPSSVQDGIVAQNAFDERISDPVLGFGRGDINWTFDSNTGIQDSLVRGGFTIRDSRDIPVEQEAADRFDEDAYTIIGGPVDPNDVLERTEVLNIDGGALTYVGRFDVAIICNLVMTLSGTNDVFAIGIFRNGNLLNDSVQIQAVRPAASNVTAQVQLDVNTQDEFEVGVANIDSTSDVTVRSVNFVVQE